MLMSELAAGGGDIAAAGGADVGVDEAGSEDALELVDGIVAGAAEGEAGDFVVADEVDVGAEGFGEGGEALGVLGEVVHAVEEGVLKGDFATGFVEPFLARREELLDG